MPATVVLGAQWGDEGKGKLVDILAGEAAWVARFQGGNNAGHTVVIGEETFKLHLLPSGITRPGCNLVLGDGLVVDAWVLDEELVRWEEQSGEDPTGVRLFISNRAHLILPFHRFVDCLDEKIGTTGKGIGPCYADKINRVGIRVGDIRGLLSDETRLAEIADSQTERLRALGIDEEVRSDSLRQQLSWIQQRFGAAISNTGVMLDQAMRLGENLLLEGAQGCLLDIDQGTYPFVTSSVTSRGNASHGVGIHPGHIVKAIGVVKAYTTRVGHGPFTCELHDDVGEHLTIKGQEFGTTTGRRRRCGWLDLVVLRHSQRLNGFDSLALTKLDILGGLETLKICVGYRVDGVEIRELPISISELEGAQPIYIEMPGFAHLSAEQWIELARNANAEGAGIDALPENAVRYVRQIEQLLGVPMHSIGVGPDREATIHLD